MADPSPSPLHGRLAGEYNWDHACSFLRLGLVVHAAFLDAGFLPCGGNPCNLRPLEPQCFGPISPYHRLLTCRFTLPQLVRRGSDDAVTAILSQEGGRDGRRRYLLSAIVEMGSGRRTTSRSRKREFAKEDVAAVLAGSLDEAAPRMLTADAEAAAGAWLWRDLTRGICRDVFLEMCIVPGDAAFVSLPRDMKAAIMGMWDDAEHVARLDCGCDEVRGVVTMPSPLYRVTDIAEWNGVDVFGRLGLVAHAAFLDAGFLPFRSNRRPDHRRRKRVAPAPSSSCYLSRRYTLPQLADRRRADVVVITLWRAGDGAGAHFRCRAYIEREAAGGRESAKREATFAAAETTAFLSGGLDHAARGLTRAPFWSALAGGLCRDLFVDMCGLNGAVPVPEPGRLESLPGHLTAMILGMLDDGEDLARVECTCKQLRETVTEHDGELWKARYDAITPQPLRRGSPGGVSWKATYLRERLRPMPTVGVSMMWRCPHCTMEGGGEVVYHDLRGPMAISHWMYYFPLRSGVGRDDRPHAVDARADQGVPAADQILRMPARRNDGIVRRRESVVDHGYRRRHGGGAVYSPSSRYKWRHR